VLVVHKGLKTDILVATDIGVFETHDGHHWRHLSKGLPFVTVFGLARNPANRGDPGGHLPPQTAAQGASRAPAGRGRKAKRRSATE
jgi:hypothetical protein